MRCWGYAGSFVLGVVLGVVLGRHSLLVAFGNGLCRFKAGAPRVGVSYDWNAFASKNRSAWVCPDGLEGQFAAS